MSRTAGRTPRSPPRASGSQTIAGRLPPGPASGRSDQTRTRSRPEAAGWLVRRGRVRPQGQDLGREPAVRDEEADAAIPGDKEHVVRCALRVQGDGRPPRLQYGIVGDHVFRGVLQEQGRPVSFLEAQAQEEMGELVGPPVQFLERRPGPLGVESRLPRESRRGVAQEVMDELRLAHVRSGPRYPAALSRGCAEAPPSGIRSP